MRTTTPSRNSKRSNSTTSHIPSLLTLPAELRNKIHHNICHRASPIRLYFYQDAQSNTPKPVVPFASNTTIPRALFLTCRQLHSEASSVFYSSNTFLLNRTSQYATFIRPCFISALLKFFDTIGSRATLVRNIIFDTFNLYNSAYLHTYVDATIPSFHPGLDIIEVTVLLRAVWRRNLDFAIGLVDVEDMQQERAEYWMTNPDRARAKGVVDVINSLLRGQLGLVGYRDVVAAVAVRRDGSGGWISWGVGADGRCDAGFLHGCSYTMSEFLAEDGGGSWNLYRETRV
jgi:hypothetical protein